MVTDEQPYTIVVGVSATSTSPTALAWAAAQARQNGGRLIAVRAWRLPSPQATPSGTPASRIARGPDVEQAAQEALAADVAATLGADHAAEIRLVRGGKYGVLIKAAAGADLLVVDAPRQLLAGPMFAHRLVYAASCPVVVMPPRVSGEPPSVLNRVAGAIGRSVVTAAGTAGRPGYRPPLAR
ncbi:universal stress protein [uncultured Friedmanniella sp.]|uniref:universal stress protein n=1 Tax=uncultured Friedmanniella sp. TaxID=335381 RepID=UPI0035CBD668